MKPELTADRVRELFDYRDGRIYWRVKRSNSAPVGAEAARGSTQRYKLVGIDGTNYCVHRVIFLWHHGYVPKEIDHLNGDSRDNRIENLRPVTRSENNWNRIARGVSCCKQTGKWRATIYIHDRQRSLGRYGTPEEARAAYLAAKEQLHRIGGEVATAAR